MEITIDDKPIEVREGEKLLQAALRHGIEIPHFCYHPNLSIAGNCRMCLVKLEGVPKLMPACNVNVAANMKVDTATPEVQRARQMVTQFLMLNHPVDCGICDKAGECRLQDYQYAYGVPRSRSSEPRKRRRKLYKLSERIQLDNERCILCSRCVRFTREISKSNMLGIVERGGGAFVDRTAVNGVDDAYSDNIIGLCPTGALLSRDFLYKSRTWFLEPVRSVCNGCARGCSVNVWRRKKEWRFQSLGEDHNREVFRITAYPNPEINGPWLCNKGFDLHKSMARARVLTPLLRGVPVTAERAIERARQLLAQARSPAALVSAQASTEELDAFAASLASRLGTRLKIYVRQDCSPAANEVLEDNLLIKADKNPNTFGARERFGQECFVAGQDHDHDVFLVWGEMANYSDFGKAALIHLTAFSGQSESQADVCIPLSTMFERSGTFCNFEGKRNRFEKVFNKPTLAEHAHELFARLGT
jgi:NADH-quinone oxidoreductase subunit G